MSGARTPQAYQEGLAWIVAHASNATLHLLEATGGPRGRVLAHERLASMDVVRLLAKLAKKTPLQVARDLVQGRRKRLAEPLTGARRLAKMVDLRGYGRTYKQIGQEVGLSAGRARLLIEGEIRRAGGRSAIEAQRAAHQGRVPDSLSMDAVDMSVRLTNVLAQADLDTLGAVRRRWFTPTGREFFLGLRHCGPKSIRELADIMAVLGDGKGAVR